LLLNPDTFFKYSLPKRVFICVHEIMHCIWDHCGHLAAWSKTQRIGFPDGTKLPLDLRIMNVAMDLVVNDTLIESNIGEFDSAWLHDPKIATRTDSVLDTYRKLYRKAEKGGPDSQVSGGSFDQHRAPGSSSQGKTADQIPRNQQEWKAQLAAGMAVAAAQGKLPACLKRLLEEVLEPKVDWRDHIRAQLARRLGTGARDWRRPDKRLIVRDIYAPGRSGHGTGVVVIGVDTSGSIGAKTLDMFLAEVSGILEDVKPKQLFLVWCDAKVGRVDECDEVSDLNAIRAKGMPGGGGTDFRPVFNEINDLGLVPECLVYLTDGLGTFPDRAPAYPVVWGSIYPASKYPFGDVVEVPQQA
jgi:predicted metal-dependent peptidase